MEKKLPLSAALISFNEEKNIERTIRAVLPVVSEVIVVDSHSADRTREIALSLGAKVFEEDWKGHIGQKNSALDKCSCEWILCLDCDEVVDGELLQSIADAVENGKNDGYSVNRMTFYMGKFLRYSWQPDWKLRLVRRSANPKWAGYDPHDVLSIDGTSSKLTKGYLQHYSYGDMFDHYQRLVKYSKIAAESYDKNGRRFSFFSLFTKPLFAFVKKYIIKLGFMDGFAGLCVAVSTSVYVYLKYLFLKEIQDGKKKNG